jgi:glycosyltransferase involved in cell wall biosynthesis
MYIGIISTIGGRYSWAGSEETWRLFALEALRQGHHVSISASSAIARSGQVNQLRAHGVQIFARKELNGVTRRLARRRLYSRFSRFFRKHHDVIFLSMGGAGDCFWIPDLLESLRNSKIPLVIFVQANAEGMIHEESQRETLRLFYQRATKVIFLSRHNQTLLERQLAISFPHGCRIMNPLREPLGASLPWPNRASEPVRFAEVARLEVADKHQDHLLEALATPLWRARPWELTFYGSGDDEGHIRRLISFFGLQDKVHLGGYLPDFRDIWKSHHLHVIPSRREGMPLALIESMACGRPAVVTRAGGNPELVEDGVQGWVCPGMHPEVLRETLERAWQARDRWSTMGEAAYRKIQSVIDPQWGQCVLAVVVAAVQ